MPRTIAVVQASVESAAATFAAREIASPGDGIVVIHAACVLAPDSVVLHAAPHTTFSANSSAPGEVERLHDKVARVVDAKVIAAAEAAGTAPAALRVVLLAVEATTGDVAEALVAAAREEGASMLVFAREVRGGGATADDEGNCSNKGSSGFLDKLGMRAQQVMGAAKGLTLEQEILRRTGADLPLVLVPIEEKSGDDDGGNNGGGGGGGDAAV